MMGVFTGNVYIPCEITTFLFGPLLLGIRSKEGDVFLSCDISKHLHCILGYYVLPTYILDFMVSIHGSRRLMRFIINVLEANQPEHTRQLEQQRNLFTSDFHEMTTYIR